jgi:hypothetical protein
MNKVYAGIASVGFLVLGSLAGCSSADTPEGSGGKPATSAGSPSSSSGTTGVIPMGGTGSTAGAPTTTAGTESSTAGMSTSTAGTTGTGNPQCKSIKTGVACTAEGVDCPGLACGLADTGTRSCKCAGTWMCSPCDFTGTQFEKKPADVPACSGIEADKVTCMEADKGKVCTSAVGEVCACWTDDEGSLIWDCDKAPTTWAAAPAM